MTLKAVLVVVALMLLAGMIGRRFAPRVDRRRQPAVEAAQKCPACGAYRLADAPCDRADCPRG
jgi:Fe-S-cluster-containing hydrogenase component 2